MSLEHALAVRREPHGSSDDPELIDFSANTNPVTPDGVEAVYRNAFESARSYPQEPPTAFKERAAAYVNCEQSQVVPMPGGLAAIRETIRLLVSADSSVLIPYPSFGEYGREVALQGGNVTAVRDDRILDCDPSEYELVIVCNPNNPTGRLYDRSALLSFAKRCRDGETVLLVDEAFLGFTEQRSLAGEDGVVVGRALTKLFGLPGLRTGFLTATGELREALGAVRRPWNLSVPAIATGRFCMEQEEFVEKTRERVATERERMREELSRLFPDGHVYRSEAPFLLIDVGERSVASIVKGAKERGVAIRDARTFDGLNSHVRVAIRVPAENDRLLSVISDV